MMPLSLFSENVSPEENDIMAETILENQPSEDTEIPIS